jgi:site-specific DNA-methyltransferase (adenine-specific)
MRLIEGDSLKVLRDFDDDCIDLTVTSPPYDNLRTYNGNNDQWGAHVWQGILRQLHRVTKEGGVVVWVVGDATIKGSETGTSFRQALFAMDVCGFRLHDTMIYEKINYVPLTHNRYEQCFEYVFILSKGKPSTFNGIRIDCQESSRTVNRKTPNRKEDSHSIRYRDHSFVVNDTKLKSNIFRYGIGHKSNGHPAPFPEQLAHDHIISWSNPGDTILDPFMGSGTTGVACVKTDRDFIGIELDPEYYAIAKDRIENTEVQQELPCLT